MGMDGVKGGGRQERGGPKPERRLLSVGGGKGGARDLSFRTRSSTLPFFSTLRYLFWCERVLVVPVMLVQRVSSFSDQFRTHPI